MITKKELEKGGWTVAPKGVWFGVDYAESHKVNVLTILPDLLDLDTDAEGIGIHKKVSLITKSLVLMAKRETLH